MRARAEAPEPASRARRPAGPEESSEPSGPATPKAQRGRRATRGWGGGAGGGRALGRGGACLKGIGAAPRALQVAFAPAPANALAILLFSSQTSLVLSLNRPAPALPRPLTHGPIRARTPYLSSPPPPQALGTRERVSWLRCEQKYCPLTRERA